MRKFIRVLFGFSLLSSFFTIICVMGLAFEIGRRPGDELAGIGWMFLGLYPFCGALLAGGVGSVFWAVERVAKV